ncbi:hypothetical protein V5F59_08510 [Xanthobacter autotrophicus DSM 431]|uniref:hypothetical protein n=1 Tax=Xanthobacter nonsaccharivorans TaxID=3119912 RepID=UPI00372B592C
MTGVQFRALYNWRTHNDSAGLGQAKEIDWRLAVGGKVVVRPERWPTSLQKKAQGSNAAPQHFIGAMGE